MTGAEWATAQRLLEQIAMDAVNVPSVFTMGGA